MSFNERKGVSDTLFKRLESDTQSSKLLSPVSRYFPGSNSCTVLQTNLTVSPSTSTTLRVGLRLSLRPSRTPGFVSGEGTRVQRRRPDGPVDTRLPGQLGRGPHVTERPCRGRQAPLRKRRPDEPDSTDLLPQPLSPAQWTEEGRGE